MEESNNSLDLNAIRDAVQDCNINFLIGAGTSSPFLKLLGNVENLLFELSELKIDEDESKIIRASIYKYFFDGCLSKNIDLLKDSKESQAVLENYKGFLRALNYILLKRKSTILSKQVNVFTTNVDAFIEKALEDTGLEYNDGFGGRFKPKFSLSNFKKSQFKKSLHYDNTSEMPIFNLMKLHGSLTWKIDTDGETIRFLPILDNVQNIKDSKLNAGTLIEVNDDSKIADLVKSAKGKKTDAQVNNFMETYDQLAIVNPTKEKFKHTLLNQTYYELLRIYSNELEKENTVLFVAGFSFADEHIREVTLRAANSNPTLLIYILAYSSDTKMKLESSIDFPSVKNKNIKIIAPSQKTDKKGKTSDVDSYDLQTITALIFEQLLPNENKDNKKDIPDSATLETL